ncbi:hypothetical protein ACFQ1B_34120 [Streptomyces mexicanus]
MFSKECVMALVAGSVRRRPHERGADRVDTGPGDGSHGPRGAVR